MFRYFIFPSLNRYLIETVQRTLYSRVFKQNVRLFNLSAHVICLDTNHFDWDWIKLKWKNMDFHLGMILFFILSSMLFLWCGCISPRTILSISFKSSLSAARIEYCFRHPMWCKWFCGNCCKWISLMHAYLLLCEFIA